MITRITVIGVEWFHPSSLASDAFRVTRALVGSVNHEAQPIAGCYTYGTTRRGSEQYRIDVPEQIVMDDIWAGRIIDNWLSERGPNRIKFEIEYEAYSGNQ